MEPADLATDTRVTRLESAPGWYTADIPEAWSFFSPSGGVLMTAAMRAMREELGDPELKPRSATTMFLSPVPAGPLEIRVEVLRKGGLAAQVRAALSSTSLPGPGLEVSAVFARDRLGPDVIEATMPEVPKPEDAQTFEELDRSGKPRLLPFFKNFDTRLGLGHPWWRRDWEAGPARFARWFRYKRPQADAKGLLDPLAIPPIADTMPPALIQKLGPDYPRFFAPSLDLTIHFLDDTSSDWLLVHTRSRRALSGYGTADSEIWGADGKLAAIATQVMFFRQWPGN